MNKSDLIKNLANSTGLNQTQIGQVVTAFQETVIKECADGNKVSLTGFGTFEAPMRAARKGHNPQTGQPMDIPARRQPSFRAGSGFKQGVNG